MWFEFDPPVRKIYSIGLLDIEGDQTSMRVDYNGRMFPLQDTFPVVGAGDNGKQLVDLEELNDVTMVRVNLHESGAVWSISFCKINL